MVRFVGIYFSILSRAESPMRHKITHANENEREVFGDIALHAFVRSFVARRIHQSVDCENR